LSSRKQRKKNDNSFKYIFSGDLTIKDSTNPLSFDAMVKSENGYLSFSSEFEIDRTEWDIRFGSGKFFTDLGDRTIKDEIKFNAEVFADISDSDEIPVRPLDYQSP